MARKRVENREGSLGFPGFVKPVFTKESQQERQCAGHPVKTRHGAHPEHTVLQHQGEDPTGKPDTPPPQHPPEAPHRGHRREAPPADRQERAHSRPQRSVVQRHSQDTANMQIIKIFLKRLLLAYVDILYSTPTSESVERRNGELSLACQVDLMTLLRPVGKWDHDKSEGI
ncbi:hypothetical protein TNCV_2024541 [Trichonephila clavipes]|nr:hypothetical protein TNCV_2024541 [Trichonephila clavipes]